MVGVEKITGVRISVIVPTLNEEGAIVQTIVALQELSPDEIIVVDGGSTDRTRELVAVRGVRLVVTDGGRARQMNKGAELAKGEALLFLHADTRLPESGLEDIRNALRDPRIVAGRFDVALDGNRWFFRVIGALISMRSRLSQVATGDQGVFVRKIIFQQLGGFPDIPLMEDIALSRMLKRKGKIACLRSRVITSARRWEREGLWSTIVRMWWLKLLYSCGISPHALKRYYGDAR
jgi:rSAM/selenodomain-associated transferase 2